MLSLSADASGITFSSSISLPNSVGFGGARVRDYLLLPQMQRWGVGEVGFFFDRPSLYQNKPTERTPAQAEFFKRALDNMSLW